MPLPSSLAPVLVVGGSGLVGRQAVQTLKSLQPKLPVVIAGRDLGRAQEAAAATGADGAVTVDLGQPSLGLPASQAFSAIALFVKDDTLNAIRFAQDRGIGHASVSTGSYEIGPEVAHYTRRPGSAPLLMLSNWLAGAASLPTLHFAREFESVERIAIGAVLDEQDMGGPAAYADYERFTGAAPNALLLHEGQWRWATGELGRRTFVGADGLAHEGQAYSPLDVLSLAAATNARSVRLDIVVGESASRRRGEPFSTEIVIELQGRLRGGQAGGTRHELVHPRGQAPLTALGVALAIERLLGLDGGAPVPPGLYLPDVLIDPAVMVARLEAIGTRIRRTA